MLAVKALGFLAADPDRLGRFLALTGLGPAAFRQGAGDPQFMAGILDHLLADEALLLEFAAETGTRPEAVAEAQAVLSSGDAVR